MCEKWFGCLLVTGLMTGAAIAENVYQIEWLKEADLSKVWTTQGKVMQSPNGARTLLGGITDEAVTSLSLKGLPEHQVLTLEVELFLVGTWDGSNERWGQDKMTVTLDDKRILMDTTFSNCMSNNWSGSQHYPEDLTGRGCYNCFTGISQIGELGYRQSWARYEPVQTVPIDSTYMLKFSVPHTAEAFTLNFQSEANEQGGGADDQKEQWYGIGNVSVSVHNDEAVDEKLWSTLRSNLLNGFIPISNHAFWEMMQHPTRFRSDLELLKMTSAKKSWWLARAERLLLSSEEE